MDVDVELPCLSAVRRWMTPKVLIYSCPEESPVRLKMTYSSSKASVVAAASEAGGKVDHMVRPQLSLRALAGRDAIRDW